MGATKTTVFTEQQNQLADYAKAFAHPARVAILQYLIQRNACVCGDIVDELPLSQSTVSQHLKELKRIGVVQSIIEGPSVCYCIDPTAWQQIRTTMSELFASFNLKNCC